MAKPCEPAGEASNEWYAIKHDIHIYDANCNQVAIAYVNFPGDEAAWDDARHRARLIVAAVNAYRRGSR